MALLIIEGYLTNTMNKNNKQGFTLIEVLLVIGIIAILAAIVIIAINPARQLAQARNTQRWSNVNTILNAIHQYAVDNKGTLPGSIPTGTAAEVCASSVVSTSCTGGMVDMTMLTNLETYLTAVPSDPGCPTGCSASPLGVGYKVIKSANGRITVSAPNAELSTVISVTR